MIGRFLKLLVVILIVTLLTVLTYRSFFLKEIVYVDIGRLVGNYKFKKELEGKAAKDLLAIKNVIDSMRLAHRLQSGEAAIDTNIRRLEYEYGRYYTLSNEEITRQVWERLNPAIAKFGNERSYRVIVGANGGGTVLFGHKEDDITEELITYVNQSYEKGN